MSAHNDAAPHPSIVQIIRVLQHVTLSDRPLDADQVWNIIDSVSGEDYHIIDRHDAFLQALVLFEEASHFDDLYALRSLVERTRYEISRIERIFKSRSHMCRDDRERDRDRPKRECVKLDNTLAVINAIMDLRV